MKRIKKMAIKAHDVYGETINQLYRHLKAVPKGLYLERNVPKNPKPLFKKMHKGESLYDFKRRRKISNFRKREREQGQKLSKVIVERRAKLLKLTEIMG